MRQAPQRQPATRSSLANGGPDSAMRNWKLANGRMFLDDEERVGKAVCIIGVLFCCMPARRAARLNPIEALRHE